MDSIRLSRPLKLFVCNNFFVSAMDALCTGSILISYAVLLGATTLEISVLSSIHYLCSLSSLIGTYLAQKGYPLKKLSILFFLSSRPIYLLCGALGLFTILPHRSFLLCLGMFLCYFIAGISFTPYYSWLQTFCDDQTTANFLKYKYMLGKIPHLIAMAFLYFYWKYIIPHLHFTQPHGFLILFTGAFIFGILAVLFLVFIPGKNVPLDHFVNIRNFPLKDSLTNFKKIGFISWSGLFTCLIFNTYLPILILTIWKLSIVEVMLYSLINQLSFIVSINYWELFIRKFGINKSYILETLGGITIFLILSGVVFRQNINLIFLCGLSIFIGIIVSGLQLTIETVFLLKAPAKNSPIHFMLVSLTKLGVSLGVILAGGIAFVLQKMFSSQTGGLGVLFIGMILFLSVLLKLKPQFVQGK